MKRRAIGGALGLAAAISIGLGAGPTGLQSNVVFTDYTPLTSDGELLRRVLTPLQMLEVQAKWANDPSALNSQPLDLSRERFVLYVPAREPPGGYGLMVFVPPQEHAEVPPGWISLLDREGLIFVSADHSGNSDVTAGRREPLAVMAEQNVIARYPVDSRRIYIAGFSGGARAAMRIAMSYPDVFKGAVLDAGSDPIGQAGTLLPPRDLFEQFQAASRLVYLTGSADAGPLDDQTASIASMREHCVFNVDVREIAGLEHQLADSASLAEALAALAAPPQPDLGKLARCRADLERDVSAGLDRVQALLAAGHRQEAAKLLQAIDLKYGGLAAPRSVELSAALARP